MYKGATLHIGPFFVVTTIHFEGHDTRQVEVCVSTWLQRGVSETEARHRIGLNSESSQDVREEVSELQKHEYSSNILDNV